MFFSLIGCSTNKNNTNSANEVAINYLNALTEQDVDTMDKYSVVEYESIHKPIIEEAMRKHSKSEQEIYKMILDDEDVSKMPTTYQEYKKTYIEVFRKNLKKEYGEDYSVNTTIISCDDVGTDKTDILKEASNYYDKYGIVISNIIDFSAINEIQKMECKVYITGNKETTEGFSIYVIKINNKWKVLNAGIGA